MPSYCKYSFGDLYAAAYAARMPVNELKGLSQAEINKKVQRWAAVAGWYTKMVGNFLAFSASVIE